MKTRTEALGAQQLSAGTANEPRVLSGAADRRLPCPPRTQPLDWASAGDIVARELQSQATPTSRTVPAGTTNPTGASVSVASPPARDACRLLPTGPGVYRFRDHRGAVIYVGRATNLRERTLSYWKRISDRPWLTRMVPQIAAVEVLACAGVHEAAWLERNLLRRARPRWNRMAGGLEVPTWLVLDPNPRRPSLRLFSGGVEGQCPQAEPAHLVFGPYLGAVRARQLRSGLLRVWPVDLIGTAVERSRSELASLRGYDCADMRRMVQAISAALNLDPDALSSLRDGLCSARERAATGLAFELAGQINEELQAATWAGQPQRVTRTDIHQGVIFGWHAGVAVRLEIRNGLLHRWDQRVQPEPHATVSSPPDLAEFAAENAHLAARLLGRV